MTCVGCNDYTDEERLRYGRVYKRLKGIIFAQAPDAEEFRRVLNEALASGFPINYTPLDNGGWTLLKYAILKQKPVAAGLPQILIEAGADVNARDKIGNTVFSDICRDYIDYNQTDILSLIDMLLEAGAKPEYCEAWKEDWTAPETQVRRDRLEAYIAAWPERRAAQDRSGEAAAAFDYAL